MPPIDTAAAAAASTANGDPGSGTGSGSTSQPPTPRSTRHEYTSLASLMQSSPTSGSLGAGAGSGAGAGAGAGAGVGESPRSARGVAFSARHPSSASASGVPTPGQDSPGQGYPVGAGAGEAGERVRDTPSKSILAVSGNSKAQAQTRAKRASQVGGRSGWLGSVGEEPRGMGTGTGKRARGTGGKEGKMSVWRMMALTVSMGGSQIVWTVELGYGTPYLLSLGLSRQLTSLVWLAGPISGLVAQPLIGAISDSSHSRFRRRYWIVTATLLLVFSQLGLAFTEPIAEALVDLFGGGEGDWDPRYAQLVKNTAIWIAIVSFYCLDFALNALQASLRNLVLDITPGEQLASANAWHGRFNHVGNIVGFTLGYLNLANVPFIRLVGGGQFRKVCIVALALLVLTVWITCWTQEEQEKESIFGERRSKLRDIIGTIYEAARHLPKPVRRVCIVQIAAFMGWFPYLFYSTTYVAEVMAQEHGVEPDPDVATRAGSLALLIYSFVAIIAGTLLPYLAARDRRLLRPAKKEEAAARRAGGAAAGEGEEESDDEDQDEERDQEMERVREMVREWKREAARQGRPLKLPTMPFMLRNIWTAGLLLFAAVMASTFFIRTVWQATVAIGIVGICWAIACWVPFAIIMEFLKEMDDTKTTSDSATRRHGPGARAHGHGYGGHAHAHGQSSAHAPHSAGPHSVSSGFRPIHARAASTPLGGAAWRGPPSEPGSPTRAERATERTGLLQRSYSTADVEGQGGESMEYTGPGPVAGGTVMGIHNLAIVFPQFIIAAVASVIFKLADGESDVGTTYVPGNGDIGTGAGERAPKNGVVWVLRFGGLMALVGALISRKVPPTKTEKAMRRRLAEMRGESEE